MSFFLHTFYVYTFLLLVNCKCLVFIFFYHCYAQLKILALIIAQYKFIHYDSIVAKSFVEIGFYLEETLQFKNLKIAKEMYDVRAVAARKPYISKTETSIFHQVCSS